MILGLYIAVVCASGSAVVFRNDLYNVLETLSATSGIGTVIAYRILKWMSDLHGNLFLGSNGMVANAIGGFLTAAVCLTGLVTWWPGIAKWRRGLTIRGGVGWKRLTFDLHSAVGFWTFALVLMWGVTGGYFVFPQPFRDAIEYFTPINPPALPQAQPAPPPPPGPATLTLPRRRRPLTLGQKILRGFSLAHYGNFAGWPVKVLWVLLGFAPMILFITAVMMWWNRVLSPAMRRARARFLPQLDASERK